MFKTSPLAAGCAKPRYAQTARRVSTFRSDLFVRSTGFCQRARGVTKTQADFVEDQNWIGGARSGNAAFVPPPADRVMECMGQLEIFLHEERRDIPLLIKAGLAHVHFETVHPFLDGNRRLGRA